MNQRRLDPRVDIYIDGAAEFAQPVLHHVRGLIHRASDEVEETIKWSRPFFLYRGRIVANMGSFKAHCSVNLWGPGMKALVAESLEGKEAGEPLRHLTCLSDLPTDKVLMACLRAAFRSAGTSPGTTGTTPRTRKAGVFREKLDEPVDFAAALAKAPGATERFAAMSASCRREYLEWIAEAKRPETRQRRLAESVIWIAEGKRRNWKYESRLGGNG